MLCILDHTSVTDRIATGIQPVLPGMESVLPDTPLARFWTTFLATPVLALRLVTVVVVSIDRRLTTIVGGVPFLRHMSNPAVPYAVPFPSVATVPRVPMPVWLNVPSTRSAESIQHN